MPIPILPASTPIPARSQPSSAAPPAISRPPRPRKRIQPRRHPREIRLNLDGPRVHARHHDHAEHGQFHDQERRAGLCDERVRAEIFLDYAWGEVHRAENEVGHYRPDKGAVEEV